MSEEMKQDILAYMEKSSSKGKKKLYGKDIAKGLSDKYPSRDVKKKLTELLTEGELCYWSSGSTTYVMLKKDWEVVQAQENG